MYRTMHAIAPAFHMTLVIVLVTAPAIVHASVTVLVIVPVIVLVYQEDSGN